MSKIIDKINYYRNKFGGSMTIKAGWDTRTKNAKGAQPCVYMKTNEYGTRYIPPRPALRITSRRDRSIWQRMLRKGMESSIEPMRLGNLIGSRMRGDIQKTIISNVPPPNSPATRKAKAKHGNNGGTLRDTLFAYQTVTYVVEKR